MNLGKPKVEKYLWGVTMDYGDVGSFGNYVEATIFSGHLPCEPDYITSVDLCRMTNSKTLDDAIAKSVRTDQPLL